MHALRTWSSTYMKSYCFSFPQPNTKTTNFRQKVVKVYIVLLWVEQHNAAAE